MPFLPKDSEIASINEDRSFELLGHLCFVKVRNISDKSDCVLIYNQTAAWFQLSDGHFDWTESYRLSLTGVWLEGWWPTNDGQDIRPPGQPHWAPFCFGNTEEDLLFPWTGCQDRVVQWAKRGYFTFSPGMGTTFNATFAGYNYTWQDPSLDLPINPYNVWLLCGINGSCTDLSPMAMIGGGAHGIARFLVDTSPRAKGKRDVFSPPTYRYKKPFQEYVHRTMPGRNISFSPTPICVWAPFVFIVSNSSQQFVRYLNCNAQNCFYSMCWDAERFPIAIVARLPRWVPVPVEAPNSLAQFRSKRDFGITAAIVAAISIAAAGAAAAAIAMDQTVQTAHALNNLSANTAAALDLQASLNAQLKGGLMLVNQRVDLVQEQVNALWQLAQVGCEWKFPGLCVTSIQFQKFTKAANLSRKLSNHLAGDWSADFDGLMKQLRMAVVAVNSTRLDPSLTTGFMAWVTSAIDHLKEWAGMGSLAILLVLASFVCLWCICKIRATQKRNTAMVVQAFAAIEAGQSPQAWLATMKP